MKALGPLVPEPSGDRFASLDGLRGLLALFVLSHHSFYWYGKLSTGSWSMPSILYENLGKGSVCLFFMVSSFLFFGKVLQSGKTPIDWLRFGVSRLLRLTPLYIIAITMLLIEVGITSHWQIRTGPRELIAEIFSWLNFTIPGSPDINQVKETSQMVAGVTWSLTYEWFFYALLPFIAFLSARQVPPAVLLGSIAASLTLYKILHPNPWILTTFLGGMLATWIVRWGAFNNILRSPWLTPLIGLLLYQSWTINYKPWNPSTLLLLTLVFTSIAAGNSFLGLLTNGVSRKLGEVSYGIYLFHGLVLFAMLQLSPLANLRQLLQPFYYLCTVLLATMLTVLISSFGFRLIEAPCMALTGPLTTMLRGRISLLRGRGRE